MTDRVDEGYLSVVQYVDDWTGAVQGARNIGVILIVPDREYGALQFCVTGYRPLDTFLLAWSQAVSAEPPTLVDLLYYAQEMRGLLRVTDPEVVSVRAGTDGIGNLYRAYVRDAA